MGGKEWPTQPLEPGWYCMMCRNEGTFIQNAATEKLTQSVVEEEQLSFGTVVFSSGISTVAPISPGKVFQGRHWDSVRLDDLSTNFQTGVRVGKALLDDKGPCNVCGCRLYMKVEKVEHDED